MSIGWQNKPTVQTGKVGEAIVKERLLLLPNHELYEPHGGKAHGVDFMMMRNTFPPFGVEVKTKPAMVTRTPPRTGFDFKQLLAYQALPFPVLVAFVDSDMGRVYGGYLDEFEAGGTFERIYSRHADVATWAVHTMNDYGALREQEILALGALCQRAKHYEEKKPTQLGMFL